MAKPLYPAAEIQSLWHFPHRHGELLKLNAIAHSATAEYELPLSVLKTEGELGAFNGSKLRIHSVHTTLVLVP